ncbi:MAG: AsmA family protein, partial [Rudaea sp.]
MKRKGKILLGICTALVLLVVIALIVLATFDWNRAKPWLADNISQALGRTVAIDGDMRVSWQRDPDIHGWRGWLPGPHLALAKVSIGNTDWAKSRTFATMKATELSLDLFPLLAHTLSIPLMHVIAPDVHLERLADGRDNWTFAAGDAASPWKLDLGRIQLDQGEVVIVDGKNDLDAKIHVEALRKSIPFEQIVAEQEASSQRDAAARVGASGARELAQNTNKSAEPARRSRETSQFYAFGLTIEGTLKNAPLHGTGKVGGAWALKHVDRPFPLHADLRIGDTRIAFVGTLIDPTDLDALDLRLWLSGKNLSDLYDILKVALPNSPPYATEGHLVGRLTHDVKKLRYENFRARVGSSDLSGDLLYETKAPRPLLSGKVQSDLLQFRDLAPLIGADSGDTPPGKVLPERPFKPQRWQGMDANVEFTGDRVFRDSELPIHKLDTRIVMN